MICLGRIQYRVSIVVHFVLLHQPYHLDRTVLLVDDQRGRVLVVVGRIQVLL